MTAKNAILLIIKQAPGIEYNTLLSKITPNYGSVNSARAALSRAIKDMNAIGLVERKENRFFATEKGQVQIHSEMKNKLLLKLNQTIQAKNSFQNIDSIVEQLAVLIERGKADPDLLKAAKNATQFSIEELRKTNEQLKKRSHQLNYFQEILGKQIETLQQLDFKDSVELAFDSNSLEKLKPILNQLESQEIVIDCNQQSFLESLAQELNEKTKTGTFIVPKQKLEPLFDSLLEQAKQNPFQATIRISKLDLEINPPKCILTGPHSQLEPFRKK
ncbi:hypothetical protein KKE06_01585 [Candidatus Micrarchaeota archaeon]|nr:hypothetical protein [Candidatus Micrarchaeota archaeon]MBU1930885.1 hypothetical protein [Candidatus Micrarchaeota archaeon]